MITSVTAKILVESAFLYTTILYNLFSLEPFIRLFIMNSLSRKIAYKLTPGKAGPTIIHVPGLNEYTRMNGDKAMSLLR